MIEGKTFENDFFLETLTALAKEFGAHKIPLIVGGGFSLYIKTRFIKKLRSSRYVSQPFIRSTKDIDIFLSNELIVDSIAIENIKMVLEKLNFKVKTEYFQYRKEVIVGSVKRDVVLDILSQPVPANNLHKVKIKKPRIKPIGVKEFHAFYHEEAIVITSHLVNVEEFVHAELQEKFRNIFLPSSLSFIILKLHAFRDRINDEEKDFGRHHAYDIFSAIIEMDELDWKNAKHQFEESKNTNVISESIKIVSKYFISESQMGIVRLRENQNYKKDKKEYDSYIAEFISDLKEIFNIRINK